MLPDPSGARGEHGEACSWLEDLQPGPEEEGWAVQILDVQVLDRLPQSLDTTSDGLKGEHFLENMLSTEEGEGEAQSLSTTVLLFGCSEKGRSALIRVEGFRPYLYFDLPPNRPAFVSELARKVGLAPEALRVMPVRRRNMYGWIPEPYGALVLDGGRGFEEGEVTRTAAGGEARVVALGPGGAVAAFETADAAAWPEGDYVLHGTRDPQARAQVRITPPASRKQIRRLKVEFPTVAACRRAASAYRRAPEAAPGEAKGERWARCAEQHICCHEEAVPMDTKFMDAYGLVPSGWMRLRRSEPVASGRISNAPIEVRALARDLEPVNDKVDIAPLLVANLDIECVSASGGFPDASDPADEVAMIGVAYWRVGSPKESARKVCYVSCTQPCEPVPGATVICFPNEFELLRGFRSSCFVDADPDVIATYNGFGFDMPYLCRRAEVLGVDDFMFMDRIVTRKCAGRTKELSSSALGENDLFIVEMYGRCNLDMYHWIKAREKLESYKLDAVGEHFLNEKKIEMDYKDLFAMCKGAPADVARVAEYCVQDCMLLVLLAIRLQVFASNVEMSRVCHTPMELLVTRGQQVKVINQLVWHGHRMEAVPTKFDRYNGSYIMNTPKFFSGGKDDTYEGATVIDAKAKYYTRPVATLDFMSLYPSIILAHNFCFSTLVQDDRHLGVKGVTYVTIDVPPSGVDAALQKARANHSARPGKKEKSELLAAEARLHATTKTYTWARSMHGGAGEGVIPLMTRALLSARKAAKKKMAEAGRRCEKARADAAAAADDAASRAALERLEKAEVEKAVYNARQLALKVSANSIYGFTGAVKTGRYHCLAVADCVTYRAREMLHYTVEHVQRYEPCEVIYGDTDSVMVIFDAATDVESAASIGERAADHITAMFEEQTGTKDIVLEFEKVYLPYLLMRKKRYAGLMYERGKDGGMINTKLDYKGIELVRRDSCALAKRVQKKVLDALMYKMDPQLAQQELFDELERVVDNALDISDYKLSKSRKKTYVNQEQPHLHVCRKMAARRPGSEPQVGDRVPYVLTIVPFNSKAKTWEKAEDIEYARANPQACKVDRLYYVERQIVNQITSLMEHVMSTSPKTLFDPYIRRINLQQSKQSTLTTFLRPAQQGDGQRAGAPSPAATPPADANTALEDAMFAMSSAPTRKQKKKK